MAMLALLDRQPLVGLMLVTALGYTLGRLTWRGVSAGPAGGTLFVALAAGFLGVSLGGPYGADHPQLTLGMLGFTLFIYSVGFEAGPRFFQSLTGSSGWRFVVVGVAVNVLALLLAWGCSRFFRLDAATTAGMLAGALTSAPTYAAATQTGVELGPLGVAFALTYPFGLVGLVLLIQLVPRLLRQDLAAGTMSPVEGVGALPGKAKNRVEVVRAYRVEKRDLAGRALKELELGRDPGCLLSRVAREGKVFVPNGATELQVGDRILVRGRLEAHRQLEPRVGVEVFDTELLENLPPARRIQVEDRRVVGRRLAELKLLNRYQCVITRIQRGGEFIEPNGEVALEWRDVVEVSGDRDAMRRVARCLGKFEPALEEANIAIYSMGIALGLLLGLLPLWPGASGFKLGAPAGLLMAGLILGRVRHLGRFSTEVPRAAQQFVRDLGILLFIGETGLEAGKNLAEGLDWAPVPTLISGGVVTVGSVLGALAVAHFFFRLRPVDAWGSVCGGMTSSAALHTARRVADSHEVAVSYAAAYAVASVLATLAGQIIVRLVG